MKSLKERLEEKIRKESLKHASKFVNANIFAKANSSTAFETGAASLVPLVLELAEALELYAAKKSWGLSGSLGNRRICTKFNSWGKTLADVEQFEVRNSFGPIEHGDFLLMEYPGKSARQALQSLEKFLEGKNE